MFFLRQRSVCLCSFCVNVRCVYVLSASTFGAVWCLCSSCISLLFMVLLYLYSMYSLSSYSLLYFGLWCTTRAGLGVLRRLIPTLIPTLISTLLLLRDIDSTTSGKMPGKSDEHVCTASTASASGCHPLHCFIFFSLSSHFSWPCVLQEDEHGPASCNRAPSVLAGRARLLVVWAITSAQQVASLLPPFTKLVHTAFVVLDGAVRWVHDVYPPATPGA